MVQLFGVPVDFLLFGATLLGVALLHNHTLKVALAGVTVIILYKLGFPGFAAGPGLGGLASHLHHEWVTLANLLGLLLGFALLSNQFERSELPAVLPKFLPDDWKGGLVLLGIIAVLSSFLDNIAAALVGGTIARVVFKGKVHLGYLAAIVAASNAGGAGSVVGDTTTTMMWIAGVSPLDVLHAFIASGAALVVFGIPAALQQHKYQPIAKDPPEGVHVDWVRVGIVAAILVSAISANVICNLHFPEVLAHFPVIGATVLVAVGLTGMLRAPDWKLLPGAFKGSVFLLSLVVCASLMPVERLPAASWPSALGLGFVSAVFDNIPLTALALKQGGYDWGMLAYAVGFGGSMVWFGSSAGVALSSMYPEARSVGGWLKNGWHVTLGYVVGFFVLLTLNGWNPHAPHKLPEPPSPVDQPTISAPAVAGAPAPAQPAITPAVGSSPAPAQPALEPAAAAPPP